MGDLRFQRKNCPGIHYGFSEKYFINIHLCFSPAAGYSSAGIQEGGNMTVRKIERAPSAYDYPLLIKNLFRHPLIHSPNREIVYRDQMRYNYKSLRQRIARLANALESLGVKQGDIIGIMDWDSHRYLEAFLPCL